MDNIPIRLFPELDEEEYRRLVGEEPWEAVIYLASCGYEEQARKLCDELRVKDLHARMAQEPRRAPQPMLTDGVLINGPDNDGRSIIGVADRRYDVELAIDPPPAEDEMIPGREVWVNPETMAIVKLRDTYIQGEAAPIIEIVTDRGMGEASALSHTPARLLLRVKSRHEEIVVETVPALAQAEPAVGDTVRILPSLGIALDLLERGRKDVQLSEVPDVEYEDIGGLDAEIAQINEAVEIPYTYPAVYERYQLDRPRGILLYGPPGCGKTMIAKAIAHSLSRHIERSLCETRAAIRCYLCLSSDEAGAEEAEQFYYEWRSLGASGGPTMPSDRSEGQGQLLEIEQYLHSRGITPARAAAELRKIEAALAQGGQSYFISIKGPELLSKWVGETESSIRGIFEMARERASFHTPVVLFFDELESMFSRRGSGISSDVQKTIVPQLLAEIDGVEESRHIMVIGASNRLDLIDPAVLRPGRLDYKIKIPRPNRDAARAIIGRYLTPELPFPPSRIVLDSAAHEALGGASASAPALCDCLVAALDRLVRTSHNLWAAIFLNERYSGRRSDDLRLYASAGVESDAAARLGEAWGINDGPAAAAAASGQFQPSRPDPLAGDDERWASAWPIIDPADAAVSWGALVVGHPDAALSEQLAECGIILASAIAATIHTRRNIANQLADNILHVLFHDESYLLITELVDQRRTGGIGPRPPQKLEKPIKDIVSGAMLSSVVSRAKRLAVKREIQRLGYGVIWEDCYQAILDECRESKDQYVFELYGDDPWSRDHAYHDTERFYVEVVLASPGTPERRPTLLTTRSYAWRAAK